MILLKLNKIIKLDRKKIAIIIVFSIIEAFFLVSSIYFLYPFINFLVDGQSATIKLLQEDKYQFIYELFISYNISLNLINLIALAILPVILGQMIKYIKTISIVKMQQNIIYKLRKKFIQKLFNTNILYLKSLKMGELSNSISTESMRVGISIQYMINFLSFAFISCIYFLILFNISMDLLFYTIIGVLVIPFIVKKQNKELKHLGRIVSGSNENIQSFIIEKVKNLKKIILCNKRDDEIENFHKISERFEFTYFKSGSINALVDAVLEPLILIIAMCIIYIGVERLSLKFDVIILFLFVLIKFNQSLKSLILQKNQMNAYLGSFELYSKYLKNLDENQVCDIGRKKFETLKNSILLQNIDFSYSDKNNLFNKVNLEFKVNQTTAIIGKSGSGKSTIIDIVLGFNKVSSGSVFYDDDNIEDLDFISLRNKIGFVTQENYLFYGTIEENLLYGTNKKSHSDIVHACKQAHIYDFIQSLENGFATHIGESGGKLSGGQKQRLQLAHLFLQDPEIIILDEPTSALDNESEKVIVDVLKKLHGKKTIIIIAHRHSTIEHADKIVAVQSGKVVEIKELQNFK